MSRLFISILAFASLAGMTLAMANPTRWSAEGWATDFSRSRIDFSSVRSGGPPRDGIPPIDKPKFVAADAVADLTASEPVITLTLNGVTRAYPLRVMTWHEIVNDTIGGVPVTVTYCPLCNAAIVFDRRVGEAVLDFGTTGKLRNSDLIMYDRQSESWWQQFTGEAIVGRHAGTELTMLPSRLEPFGDFAKRHPKGDVLVPNNPAFRRYGQNPYVSYDRSRRPFLYDGALPEGIEPMARVVVIDGGTQKSPRVAVSLALLRERGSYNVEGTTLHWKPGQNSALDTSEIARGRDVGTVIATRDDEDVRYDVTFAFVFHAFHPNGRIVTRIE